jgi:hypothetical protein
MGRVDGRASRIRPEVGRREKILTNSQRPEISMGSSSSSSTVAGFKNKTKQNKNNTVKHRKGKKKTPKKQTECCCWAPEDKVLSS